MEESIYYTTVLPAHHLPPFSFGFVADADIEMGTLITLYGGYTVEGGRVSLSDTVFDVKPRDKNAPAPYSLNGHGYGGLGR